MTYSFDEVIDRRGQNSYKWNVGEQELPMWVADMDFSTAPAIREVLERKVRHGVYGYMDIPDAWGEAYAGWWKTRHGFETKPEWYTFCTGVIPALSAAVRKLTTPGEKVLIQTPVYNHFYTSIRNNGRVVAENRLIYEDGTYHMDLADLEHQLQDPQVTLMFLCNPQNPGGKIWSREILRQVGEMCCRNHVVVVADEIHCDLTEPGLGYVPFASVSEECRRNSITCVAPTKTFNIAGIQTAAVMAADENLRHKMWRELNTSEVAEPNVFAIEAAIAAYTGGAQWLDDLREYLSQNKTYLREKLAQALPEIAVTKNEATYLMWLDCGGITKQTDELTAYIRKSTGLYLSKGSQFGSGGERFIRWNVACPRATLVDGIGRFIQGVERFRKQDAESVRGK